MTPSDVSYAARRGEVIVRENDSRLTEGVI